MKSKSSKKSVIIFASLSCKAEGLDFDSIFSIIGYKNRSVIKCILVVRTAANCRFGLLINYQPGTKRDSLLSKGNE